MRFKGKEANVGRHCYADNVTGLDAKMPRGKEEESVTESTELVRKCSAAKIRSTFLSHLVLILVSLISIFPFIWLISTSLKGNSENIFAYPPQIIPQDFTWANYTGVWDKVNFIGYFINSMIVAGGTVILNLILSAMAGYPLARMEFK